jgi:hypothetical protein
VRALSNFEQDPLKTVKELEQGLRLAKSRYRYYYKQIMMSIIDHDLKPTRHERKLHNYRVIGANLGIILAAIFNPKNYEYSIKYAESTQGELDLARQNILDESSRIIDRLSQKERIEYLYDVIFRGITEANKKWRDMIPVGKGRYVIEEIIEGR